MEIGVEIIKHAVMPHEPPGSGGERPSVAAIASLMGVSKSFLNAVDVLLLRDPEMRAQWVDGRTAACARRLTEIMKDGSKSPQETRFELLTELERTQEVGVNFELHLDTGINQRTQVANQMAVLLAIGRRHDLHHLHVNNSVLELPTDAVVKSINRALDGNEELKSAQFRFVGIPFSPDELGRLAAAMSGRPVTSLTLAFQHISENAMQRLAAHLPSTKLHELRLDSSYITDSAAASLAQKLPPGLKALTLCDNALTDRGAQHLVSALPGSMLQIVDLSNNIGIDSASRQALRRLQARNRHDEQVRLIL